MSTEPSECRRRACAWLRSHESRARSGAVQPEESMMPRRDRALNRVVLAGIGVVVAGYVAPVGPARTRGRRCRSCKS